MKKIKIYNKIRRILLNPFFCSVAVFFSHGATHFLFFVIIGSVTAYLFFLNNNEEVTPHNLKVYVDYSSYYQNIVKRNNSNNNLCVEDVNIEVLLNSDSLKTESDGVYSNGVKVSFTGRLILHHIYKPVVSNLSFANSQYAQELYIDSMVVSLYSSPEINKCGLNVNIDPDLGYGETYRDSVSGFLTTHHFVAGDTKVDYKSFIKNGEVTAFIAPRSFEKGKTRHNVCFYSDEIGVKKHDPYYYYFISFPTFEFEGNLRISFRISDQSLNWSESIANNDGVNLQYNFIYPEPDIIGNGVVSYYSPEKIEKVRRNKGVVIQAVDIKEQNRQNRNSFLLSVLIGTGFAFLLDIIIQLIKELRRLQNREKELTNTNNRN